MTPVALRRDGVLGPRASSARRPTGGSTSVSAWRCFTSVVADGSPPSRDELLLAAVALFAGFWLVSAYTWAAIAAARLLAALRRR